MDAHFMDAHVQNNIKETVFCKPFVKWVGGKRSITEELKKRLPNKYKMYHEPFLGGGALFFDLQPEETNLSDRNINLIKTYSAIKDNVHLVIDELKKHKKNHAKKYYLNIRSKLRPVLENHILAGMFIYLNKTCYNGLYRVNKDGHFNVPLGSYKNPCILDEENLINCSQALKGVSIKIKDYSQIAAKEDDLIYFDPPYHGTYDQYDSNKFSEKDHRNLSELCSRLNSSKIKFMLSNSNNEFIRKLFKKYKIEEVESKRFVSCKSEQRGNHSELIIRNYE